MHFHLASYVDLRRVLRDYVYAKEKHLLVTKCKPSQQQFIDAQIQQLSVQDPMYHMRLAELKQQKSQQLTKQKENPTYVIKYDKRFLTKENITSLGLFRSVVVNEDGILSFSPSKALPFHYFKDTWDGSAAHGIIPLEFVEGTMINVFYDPTRAIWEMATRSNIGAHYAFYRDHPKTFHDMFMDVMGPAKFAAMESKYSYSFVLQHPDNRIVIPFDQPKVVLTNMYECCAGDVKALAYKEVCEHARNLGIHVPQPLSAVVNFTSYALANWENFFKNNDIDYRIMGGVFLHPSGVRTKLRNPNYEYVRSLRGNSPKLQYQYYHIRQLGQMPEFLRFYPELKGKCAALRSQLHEWSAQLYKNYVTCYIKRDKLFKEYSKEFQPHMYSLHQIYLRELRPAGLSINRLRVNNYVNSLEPGRLMYSINYKLRKQYLADLKKTQIAAIDASLKV